MKSTQQGNYEPVRETTTQKVCLLIFITVCFVYAFAYTDVFPSTVKLLIDIIGFLIDKIVKASLLFSNFISFLIKQTFTYFSSSIAFELSKESLFKHVE